MAPSQCPGQTLQAAARSAHGHAHARHSSALLPRYGGAYFKAVASHSAPKNRTSTVPLLVVKEDDWA